MKTKSLNGEWIMEQQNGERTKGQIPGSVYSFLLDAGKMENPHVGENELSALALMEEDYSFETTFDTGEEILAQEHQAIVFDGIDTLAEVSLNGTVLGRADNFFRRWEWDVTGLLQESGNVLRVDLDSPLCYIREKDAEQHFGGSRHAMKGFPQIRKPHCMFGWDWGPRLPDAGIWKDVTLIGFGKARLEDVSIEQDHSDGVSVTVTAKASGGKLEISLTTPEGEVFSLENGTPYKVKNPQLWWPNGLGDQPLYTVTVQLKENGELLEESKKRIGLRTLTIHREKDEWGESFAHEVNGIRFFGMGANYIPEDNVVSRITPERTRRLLEDSKACHFNVIRVWGGGWYPNDFFYDLCDELGLVVWQDMMYACANYNLTDEFEESITAETVENVRRIRHHACLGLWCGNNEMEWLANDKKYDGNDVTKAYYIRMFEQIIPKILKKEDPHTYYWPSSPSSGGSFDEPNSPYRGDVHNWEVWHSGVPFSEYRKYCFRYLSEFGFQSFPCLQTVAGFAEKKDWNVFSRVMERHQRNEGANGKILQYLSMTYLYPSTFENLLYASQLLQADAIRYGVEHFRRNRGQCMGAIYWQLNDIWPVASWASLDYHGRWKALHYVARRFFAPIMLSCKEECEVTTKTSIVMESDKDINTAQLCVANETKQDFTGTVSWSLRDAGSRVICRGEEEVCTKAFSSHWLAEMDFSDTDYLENHLTFALTGADGVVSEGSVLFTAPKHYHFRDPELKVTRQGALLTVEAKNYARSVELYSENADAVLSDNFFDMEAGTKTVRIVRGEAQDWKARSVYDIGL